IYLNGFFKQLILKRLCLDIKTEFSESFSQQAEDDYRYSISPKIATDDIKFTPYYQVFSEKLPFEPNLSIIDLIFCMGPEAKNYLTQNKEII
ncbi:MAG: WbqC family protein, partial [Rikenellaceae bacterium]